MQHTLLSYEPGKLSGFSRPPLPPPPVTKNLYMIFLTIDQGGPTSKFFQVVVFKHLPERYNKGIVPIIGLRTELIVSQSGRLKTPTPTPWTTPRTTPRTTLWTTTPRTTPPTVSPNCF